MQEIDEQGVSRKRKHVVAAVVAGLVLSTLSTLLRVWARVIVVGTLRKEDWTMMAGLALTYGNIAATLYGLAVGIWIVQKIQPVALLLIKTSMMLFNAHIFHTRHFVQASWALWVLTLCWTLVAVLGTVFQCSPPSMFWNKNQSESCSMGALKIIGLSTSIASSVGDIIILMMPIPFILRLKLSKRRRAGLVVVFTFGALLVPPTQPPLFAGSSVAASFIRWTTLLSALASGQIFTTGYVNVVIWTYLEMSIGITCGNLPFLATLLGRPAAKRVAEPSDDMSKRVFLPQRLRGASFEGAAL
ncbi:hypothetical protein B0T14DRAFT_590244 [Immersiella caudata]|uniref:Rhodopsin domain-containing protein n=1 Tax=Immersiella caudata TaxID=314043 RepID=A0AA39WLI8_9PEZI|nr:hypothetical protein B0T14DRAFT_590244 [Immersiella caudata]